MGDNDTKQVVTKVGQQLRLSYVRMLEFEVNRLEVQWRRPVEIILFIGLWGRMSESDREYGR